MRARAIALGLFLGGCKIEPVGELPPPPDPHDPPVMNLLVIPELRVVDEESSLLEAELRRQLSLLTSPYLGGRRPGTEGATLTAGHIERSMRQMGLAPAGVGGGWRQPVVVRVRSTEDGRLELPGSTPEAEPEILRHGEDVVLWRTAQEAGPWSQDLALVDVGYGIEAPAIGHDDFAGLDVRGKLLLVQAGVPSDASFDADETARYGALAYKLAHAAKKGAAGCLVTTGALREETAWAETVARYGGAHVDQPGAKDAGAAPALVGMLSAEGEARVQAWLTAASVPEPTAPPGTRPSPRQVQASVVTSERTIVDATIVGRIPGRDRPYEVVVVLAHWDAGGLSAPLPDGGALADNATGVAALLTVARRSAEWTRRGHAPSRSIAFVATASDTLGGAGARALVSDSPLSHADIVAVISLDELSTRAEAPALGAVDLEATSLADVLETVRPSIQAVDTPPHDDLGHEPALEAGIAAVTMTQHDPHAPAADVFASGDLLDPLVSDVVFVFDVAWRLAESSQTPTIGRPEPADPPAGADAP